MCLAECVQDQDIFGPAHFERTRHDTKNVQVGAECGNVESCF